jgi:outer membrane protein assembly factor BamA
MKGNITYDITTPAQTQFTARWDNVTDIDYYIRFDIKPIVAGVTFDQDGIKQYMRDNINLRIGDYAETASITDIAQKAIESVGGQGYAVNVEISTDELSWEEYLEPVVASRYVIAGITITEL